ncbi:hypothetical protein F945_01828 [Acinetobacter rudis CIP 110305]|uniref:Uncharacterized protein n=1 Tax=Acinetobacter rudis CIP 110305 TaxID=421052 RepID=S3NHW9_9GAMM|nr:hypothetical protein F945_01828 [Acinetobacter rudis CIP 110305]
MRLKNIEPLSHHLKLQTTNYLNKNYMHHQDKNIDS